MNDIPHRIVPDTAGAVDQNEPNQTTAASAQFQSRAVDYARAYVARGWHVLPLHNPVQTEDALICSCGNAGCRTPAKHPRDHNGEKGASNDPAQINAWWQQWPDANIGIATGPSGLAVIDVDCDEGYEH